MQDLNYKIPILFVIFNRPETTAITFEAIKKVKPQKLYIAADGARQEVEEDILKCKRTRDIIQKIDWNCEVKTLFRNENLGVVKGVISAIDWFFANEDHGIILEDDCLPSDSFWLYMQILLNYYKENEEVMHISGSNFIDTQKLNTSIYFSYFGSCWGWASWRRAWKKYDLNLIENVSEKDYLEILKKVSITTKHYNYFKNHLNYHRTGNDNIWDWRWTFCIWFYNGIVINPKYNMIKNIGYGTEATTSKGKNQARNKIAALETFDINKIIFPKKIEINKELEIKIQNIYNPPLTFKLKIKKVIGKIIPSFLKKQIKKMLYKM